MPLALLYLKAHLVRFGGVDASSVTIEEFTKDADAEAIARAVVAGKPDVVGMSCYIWNCVTLLDAAQRIRAALPDVKIVLGGPEVGPVAEAVLARNRCVDAIVRSEGEEPFRDLVVCIRDHGEIAEVAGITYRCGDRIVSNPDAPIQRDLNYVTSPHLLGYVDHRNRIVCLETQRGCVFTCNFCFYNKDYSIRNRRFDLPRVKEEILFWLDQDIHEIYLMDPVFNLNAARSKEILRFIIEHNHRRVQFHTEVWAEFIDDEMAELFAQANFLFLEVGLQSSDHAVLEAAERRHRPEAFLEGIGFLKKHKLTFELQLIAGLPGDTRESFIESLNFAATLNPPTLAVFGLMILPGTELWRKADELDVKYDANPPYLVRSHKTMNESDLVWVHEMAHAARTLWRFYVLRLLSRANKQCTYSGMVEEWNAWNPGSPDFAQVKERLLEFIQHYCDRHDVDPQFFLTAASVELR